MEVFTTIEVKPNTYVTHEDIVKLLIKYSPSKFIVGFELTLTSNKKKSYLNPHYHIYSVHEHQDWLKFYDKLRKRLSKLSISKCKPELVDKSENAQIYVCKGKNFVYEGYPINEIQYLNSKSYDKPLPYKQQMLQLERDFIEKQIPIKCALMRYSRIHQLSRVNYDERRMKMWMTRLQCSRDPKFEEKMIEKVANAFYSAKIYPFYANKGWHTKEEYMQASAELIASLEKRDDIENRTTLT